MSAMLRSRRSRWSLGVLAAGVIAGIIAGGCADTDPNYGKPDAIRGRTIDYGTSSGGTTTPTDSGGAPRSARQLFADLHTTFAGGSGTCLPCHNTNTGGQTPFAVPDVDASYGIFKQKMYNVLATPNSFYTRGKHGGPELTPAQKSLTEQWSAAEAAGGTPIADAGGGG